MGYKRKDRNHYGIKGAHHGLHFHNFFFILQLGEGKEQSLVMSNIHGLKLVPEIN